MDGKPSPPRKLAATLRFTPDLSTHVRQGDVLTSLCDAMKCAIVAERMGDKPHTTIESFLRMMDGIKDVRTTAPGIAAYASLR